MSNTNQKPSGLGLLGYDSFHFAVEHLERSRDFYINRFDFREVARSGPTLTERSGQRSAVMGAGDVRVVISTPESPRSKAARYLKLHPAGVMSVSFLVQDIDVAWKFLEARDATFLSEIFEERTGEGSYRSFEIATPLGDLNFRMVEKRGYSGFAPGFESLEYDRQPNRYGIVRIDHITSNMRTMAPYILWLEHVMGFSRFWDVQFHTEDVKANVGHGSGLKSIVMWDPGSGIRFANNEPLRPYFNDSQIARFVEANAGPGVQHAALEVDNLIAAVGDLRARGVEFLPTPGTYYDVLAERLRGRGVPVIKEPVSDLRALEILVDGRDDHYMLQIFLKEAANLYNDPKAGPFFFELIQRCGYPGFGEGNFRALFEAIEREQSET